MAGALPQILLGELTALPRPLAGFKGPTSKGRGEERREGTGPLYFFFSCQSYMYGHCMSLHCCRCSTILVFAGMYGFYVVKKSVDRGRVELMKSKQRIRNEHIQEMHLKLDKDS